MARLRTRNSCKRLLPNDLLAELERILLDQKHGGYTELEEWLKEKGYNISRCTIWRYDQMLQKQMEKIRGTAEAARILAQALPDKTDNHSAALLKMVQSNLFTSLLEFGEQKGTPQEKLKTLSSAARAVSDSTRASVAQKRWAEEFDAKLAKAEETAKKDGKRLDAKTLKIVRETLYGR